MTIASLSMLRSANALDRVLARGLGRRLPIYYVAEYPKSGGTWLSHMLADALQAPYPRFSHFPIGCRAVLHKHWGFVRGLDRVVYLYRDGRDVAVSAYFHQMRQYKDPASRMSDARRRALEATFGAGFDPDDSRGNLPTYLRQSFFQRGFGTRLNWRDHCDGWRPEAGRPGVAYVSYEQLRADPVGHLQRLADHLAREPVERWRVEWAVDKFSMERQTGRAAGQEDRKSFIRKGVVGDWRNHFTAETARMFDEFAGGTLIRLGYESDHAWVDRLASDMPADTRSSSGAATSGSAASARG